MVPRARILAPLFVGFLVLAMAFVAIGYVEFRTCTIDDCVHYAYGLNSLIADDLDLDHVNDYIEQGRAHPDYERIERHLTSCGTPARKSCSFTSTRSAWTAASGMCSRRADAAMYEDKVAMNANGGIRVCFKIA